MRSDVASSQVVRGPADDCLDAVQVVLKAPLAGRDLLDRVSAEAAFAHALEADAADVPVRESATGDERVEHSHGRTAFEFRENEGFYPSLVVAGRGWTLGHDLTFGCAATEHPFNATPFPAAGTPTGRAGNYCPL